VSWSSGNSSQAHKERVTIFDDRHNVYRTDDINRLRAYSALLALSDRQAVRDLLAA
jgi:hypothetical protein